MAVDTGTIEVVMPAMGDSVSEGTVLEWHKQVGDTIAADETLVEISTDKVDAEVPSPASGTITKIHAAEGDTVAVGALLAEISAGRRQRQRRRRASHRGAAPRQRRLSVKPAEETPVSGESPPATAAEAAAGQSTEAEGMAAQDTAEGKTSTSSPRPAASRSPRARSSSGRSRSATRSPTATPWSRSPPTRSTWSCPPRPTARSPRSWPQEGDTVTVGQVIARMTRLSRQGSASPAAAGAPTARRPRPPPRPRQPTAPPPPAADVDASPVARRVAAAEGVDLSQVTGSARGGRITKADVLAAGNGAQPPAPGASAAAAASGRPARSSSRAAARRWPGTWIRAARSPPPPRSAPSP